MSSNKTKPRLKQRAMRMYADPIVTSGEEDDFDVDDDDAEEDGEAEECDLLLNGPPQIPSKVGLTPKAELTPVNVQRELQKNMRKFIDYFSLYRDMSTRPGYVAIFRQRNLSYMPHRLEKFLNGLEFLTKEDKDKENHHNLPDQSSQPNSKASGSNVAIKISEFKISESGFKYAQLDFYIVRLVRLKIEKEGKPPLAPAVYFLGTLDVEFAEDGSLLPVSSSIPIPDFDQLQLEIGDNQNNNYRTGVNIRLIKTDENSSVQPPVNNRSVKNEETKFFRCLFDNLSPRKGEMVARPFKVNKSRANMPLTRDKWIEISNDWFDPKGTSTDYLIGLLLTNSVDDCTSSLPSPRKLPLSEISLNIMGNNHSLHLSRKSPKDLPRRAKEQHQNPLNENVRISFTNIQRNLWIRSHICPICFVSCGTFDVMRTHLKICHARFSFHYETGPECKVIKISINENFDGDDELESFGQKGVPTKAMTTFLVTNELRSIQKSCNDKWGTDYELDDIRTFLGEKNKKRTYFHSQTATHIVPNEIDYDSEDDNYNSWYIRRQVKLIEEFTDVNYGEKTICKMWNQFGMETKKSLVANNHVASYVNQFYKEKQAKLFENRGLVNNFKLLLCNLKLYGFITSEDLAASCETINRDWEEHKRKRAEEEEEARKRSEEFAAAPGISSTSSTSEPMDH